MPTFVSTLPMNLTNSCYTHRITAFTSCWHIVKTQIVVSFYKSRSSTYIKCFFLCKTSCLCVRIATGLASQGHPSAGAIPSRVPWGVAFPCPPAMVPGRFAEYQALRSFLQMLKCWSAKFTDRQTKQVWQKGCWWIVLVDGEKWCISFGWHSRDNLDGSHGHWK